MKRTSIGLSGPLPLADTGKAPGCETDATNLATAKRAHETHSRTHIAHAFIYVRKLQPNNTLNIGTWTRTYASKHARTQPRKHISTHTHAHANRLANLETQITVT